MKDCRRRGSTRSRALRLALRYRSLASIGRAEHGPPLGQRRHCDHWKRVADRSLHAPSPPHPSEVKPAAGLDGTGHVRVLFNRTCDQAMVVVMAT